MSLAYSDTSSWFQHYQCKWRVLYCDMSTVTNYHCNLNSSTNTGPGQNSLNIRLFLQSDFHNIRYPLFLTVISITNVKRINLSLIPCSISYLIFIKSSPHRASHIWPSSALLLPRLHLRSDQMVESNLAEAINLRGGMAEEEEKDVTVSSILK